MISLLVIASIGIAIAAVVAFAVMAFTPNSDNTQAEDRLQALANHRPRGAQEDEPSLLLAGGIENTQSVLNALFGSLPRLKCYLDQANVSMEPTQFLLICLGSSLGGTIGLLFVPGVPAILAVLVGLALGGAPLFWVRMKRARRLKKLAGQLPEALELLSRSLRAGHSLGSGFGLIASEMSEPISVEFGRVFQEQNFGIPLDEALDDLAQRVPNMDIRFFATAVIMQKQTGGDLAEILDKIGHLVRERIKILGQVQALTGEGRLSGIVLLAMPPLLFLVMFWINKDYIMTLFNDPAGRKMLLVGVLTQIVGAFVIRKIVTIRV